MSRKIFIPLKRIVRTHSSYFSYLRTFYGFSFLRYFRIFSSYGLRPFRKIRVTGLKFLVFSEDFIQELYAVDRLLSHLFYQRLKNKVLCGTRGGRRMRLGLPARGQRTRCNAMTSYYFLISGRYGRIAL